MKKRIQSLAAITFTLAAFAVQPIAEAVVPPPDGGYPGFNTAEGQNALSSRTTGVGNTAVGWFSLFSNTDGSFNTGLGAGTLLFNVGNQSTGDGTQNTAIGTAALLNNTTGAANTATGVLALVNNTAGGGNTATGVRALLNNTTGSLNTAIGLGALSTNNGDNNTAIGANALLNTIGNFNAGADVSDSCFIGHIFGVTSSGGTTVFIDGSGKLGTITSSRRFKEQIKSMDEASTALFELKPVIFRYNKDIDPAGTSQFGLVAEEVEKVNPDLVVRDKEGKPYSVRYDQVNAMLLNEFLKEYERVEEQEEQITVLSSRVAAQEAINAREKQEFLAMIARQDKEIRALIATVKEQAAQIQKVSAQIEVSTAPLQLTAAETQ